MFVNISNWRRGESIRAVITFIKLLYRVRRRKPRVRHRDRMFVIGVRSVNGL